MKKLIALMLMVASVFFFACEEEDDKLSKEETKTEITQLSTDLSDKLTEMEESDGMVALGALMSLDYPFEMYKSNKEAAVLTNIQKYLLPYNYAKKDRQKSAFEAEPFDFEFWWGTYTWDNEHGIWEVDFDDPEDTSDDMIVINFPADTANMDNNNATATIYNYEELLVDDEYLPTAIDAELTISDIKVIDIELTAEWFTSGENIGEPTSLNASVYLIPFEFTIDFTHTSTLASIDVAILYEEAEFFTAGVSAEWENATDSIPSNIAGYISFFEVKFQADVDLKAIFEIMNDLFEGTSEFTTQEELIEAINNEIDAYVTVSGTWAADIEFTLLESADDDEDMFDILFVYADGSSESAIPYFEELGEDMETFFGELEDYYEGW